MAGSQRTCGRVALALVICAPLCGCEGTSPAQRTSGPPASGHPGAERRSGAATAASRAPATLAGPSLPMLGELPVDAPLIEAYRYLPLYRPGTSLAKLAGDIDRALGQARAGGAATAGPARRRLATLRVRLDYDRYLEREISEADMAAYRRHLETIQRGGDPFAADPGDLRGYYAANDQSCQPYLVTLPAGYNDRPAKRYPLLVFLHHHGWTDWYRPFQGSAREVDGAVVVSPHGRGSCDYLWIAEDDAIAVIDSALADYRIDPARVYVTGWSMGGTGSFHLPGRYPHRFAATFPVAGNADFTAWEKAWAEDRRRVTTPRFEARMAMRWATAPVTFAENFLHVAISFDHGEADTINPVGHSRSMAGRLHQLGYKNVQFRAGAGGHDWGTSLGDRFRWLRQFRIDPAPRRVRFKTAGYRHDTAYWVRIDRIARRMKLAEVDVEVTGDGRIRVRKADNIERLTLRLDSLRLDAAAPLRVEWGPGTRAVELPRPLPDSVTLARTGAGPWRLAEELPQDTWPPGKRKGLEGPIADVFREPFLVVIGTTAADPFTRWIVRSEAERWLRQWRRRFQAVPPAKRDTEVTAADIQAKNLILFGGPSQNAIARRIGARLPVRIEADAVVAGERRYQGQGLGLKLIYPNPENPRRSVVLFAATAWRGMWQISHRFGTWFDWMPLDNRQWFDFCVFDDRTRGFETFRDVGFFDEDWSLKQAVRFFALPRWRKRTPARNYPAMRRLPTGVKSVRLSDLWPDQIDTAREPLRIDRSLHGQALAIGHARQNFGLGQWIESAVSYNILGRFSRFRTHFGIDAEGQKRISGARKAVEFTTFQVLGDGRVLAREVDVRFGEAVRSFDVDVTGVRRLTLMVLRQEPQGWLYGPICWGEPVLSVE